MPRTPSGTCRAGRNRFSPGQPDYSGPSRSRPTAPLLLALIAASSLALFSPLDASARRSDAQSPESQTSPVCRIERATSPIHVDGKPDEAAWQGALKVEVAYEVMPGENIPAPVRTECRLAYDNDNLYALFLCTDPRPEDMRVRLSDRDGGWGDDRIGIMLDTFNDERRAFELFVNPIGTQADIFRNDVGSDESEDETWDAIWSSAGQITSEGYVAEIAIPFASLRFPRTDETNNIYVPADGGAPDDYSCHDQVTGAVLRYRRDVGGFSTLGGLTTIRQSDRYHNRVYGADGLVRFAGTEGFQFQILGSTTRYRPDIAEKRDLPAGEISDYAANLAYRHDSRNWAWSVAYKDFAPDFRADAGYSDGEQGRHPLTVRSVDRTFFAKPGYAWLV
jgi:hypothetical protein